MASSPNPAGATFRAEFYSDFSSPAVFELLDESGRLVKTLYKIIVLHNLTPMSRRIKTKLIQLSKVNQLV